LQKALPAKGERERERVVTDFRTSQCKQEHDNEINQRLGLSKNHPQ